MTGLNTAIDFPGNNAGLRLGFIIGIGLALLEQCGEHLDYLSNYTPVHYRP